MKNHTREPQASGVTGLTTAPAGLAGFTELLETVEGVLWEVDTKTLRFTYVSRQAERLLGYPISRWFEEPRFWENHIHPQEAGRVIEECLSGLRDCRNHELEYRMVAADGRLVWLRDYVTVIAENGVAVGMRGIMVDITRAKEAEERLKTLNDALMDAGRIARIGMWEFVVGGETVWWSDMTYHIHEMRPGTPVTVEEAVNFYTPEYREVIREAVEKAMEGNVPWDIVLQIDTAKGRRIWVRATGHSIWDQGKVVKVRGVFQDIDAQKRADDQLHESEKRWQFALEGSGDGVWDWDVAGQKAFFSPQLRAMLGLGEKGMGNRFEDLEKRIHPEDRAAAVDRLQDHLSGRNKLFTSEHRLLCANGSYKWVLDRGMVLARTAEGKPLRMIGTLTDITERKSLEERVRQAQKMDAVGQLAGGVAHDFNNVLATIMMHTELGLVSDCIPPEIAETLEEIKRAAQRAADLTRQLLLFSRRQTMQPRASDLNELVTNLLKMLQRLIGEHIQIEARLTTAPLLASVDPGMIDQLLMNLVVNARDAIGRHGRIVIQTEEVRVTPEEAKPHAGAKAGKYAMLRVEDNGEGIAPEHLSRVFEPFFTTREPGHGSGLGLTAVFGIVSQHKGFIQIQSQPGAGTRVDIFLPVAQEPLEEKRPDPESAAGRTILLVEDEPALRKATKRVLTKQGFRVLEAGNGPEARKVWESHAGEVELLLTDIVMPLGMIGLELARMFKHEKPGLRVIYTSGYSPDTAGRDIVWPTGQMFLQKPYSPSVLLDTIHHTFARAGSVPGAQ